MDFKKLSEFSDELITVISKNSDITSFEMEVEGFKIKIARDFNKHIVVENSKVVETTPGIRQEYGSNYTETAKSSGTEIKAPLVGIVYTAASPDEEPFINVGDKVKKGDTLFIIEAMKNMNEIVSPCDGIVSQILCNNGILTQFDEVLAIVE